MAAKGVPPEIQALFDDSVRILREDAVLAQNRALMARLDKIEQQTTKEPQTPEEKAAAYDRLIAERRGNNAGTGTNPPTQPSSTPQGQPTPPAPKPAGQSQENIPDWWWGPNDS